jgi:hypothetical protein
MSSGSSLIEIGQRALQLAVQGVKPGHGLG